MTTKPILFASDMHLSHNDMPTLHAFVQFLQTTARQAQALYLLGDIFDYWLGDDDDNPLNAKIASELKALSDNGVAIFLMWGNRDFLLGEHFAAAAGATLLPEPYPIELFGQHIVLSHGDALCTDDVPYQQLRATVRNPAWQKGFLSLSIMERRAEVARVQAMSQAAKKDKAAEIMDVNHTAVEQLFAAYPNADIIHGHTHRPARHRQTLHGAPRQRWVLPDWHAGKGGYLQADTQGLRFIGINQDAIWGEIGGAETNERETSQGETHAR